MSGTDNKARIVLVTAPVGETAERLAEKAVVEKLAACVNIVPSVSSVYRWKGKIEKDSEALLIIKTTEARLEALERFVEAEHPYDVAEFVVIKPLHVAQNYLEWLLEE